MQQKHKARIIWLTESESGRKAPPRGPIYSAPARFEEDITSWPKIAWSLVLELNEPDNITQGSVVTIHFLSTDAPEQLLRPASKFDLMEGSRVVAHGEVVS